MYTPSVLKYIIIYVSNIDLKYIYSYIWNIYTHRLLFKIGKQMVEKFLFTCFWENINVFSFNFDKNILWPFSYYVLNFYPSSKQYILWFSC